jgi:hypothetical protein
MAGFATDKFRDTMIFCATGIPPVLYNVGSTGGSAIPISGQSCPAKKFCFIGQTGSGATTTIWTFWVGGASASNGTFSMLPSTSVSFSASQNFSTSASGSVYGSAGCVVIELREEAIANLNSGVTWIKPIMSITTASAYGAMLALGYVSDYEPASLFDQPLGIVIGEQDMF